MSNIIFNRIINFIYNYKFAIDVLNVFIEEPIPKTNDEKRNYYYLLGRVRDQAVHHFPNDASTDKIQNAIYHKDIYEQDSLPEHYTQLKLSTKHLLNKFYFRWTIISCIWKLFLAVLTGTIGGVIASK